MNTEYNEIVSILRAHKATFVRGRKHEVWKFPSGQIWVIPSTPSDSHAYANNLNDLKRLLGLKVSRGEQPRREKKVKMAAQSAFLSSVKPNDVHLASFKDKLTAVKATIHPKCSPAQWWLEPVERTPLTVLLARFFKFAERAIRDVQPTQKRISQRLVLAGQAKIQLPQSRHL